MNFVLQRNIGLKTNCVYLKFALKHLWQPLAEECNKKNVINACTELSIEAVVNWEISMHFSFFGLRLGSPFLSKMQIILRPEGLRENGFNCNCLSLWRVLWGKELALSIRQSEGLHKKLTDSPNYGQFRNSLLTCMCLNSRRKLEHQEEAHSSISWAHGNQAIRSGMQLSTQYKTLNTFTS